MVTRVFAVLGLFSKQDLDTELLPPPPPFPDIEPRRETIKQPKGKKEKHSEKQEKTKIVVRNKESVKDILEQATWHEGEPEDLLGFHAPAEFVPVDELVQDGDEISEAIAQAKGPQKEGFWKKLFSKKEEMPSLDLNFGVRMPDAPESRQTNIPFQMPSTDFPPAEEKAISPIEGVMRKVNLARRQLENLDTKGAKESYVEVMKLYRMMTQDEQQRVYEVIQELYEERKSAEKMPKR
jgi:hypothetical protein